MQQKFWIQSLSNSIRVVDFHSIKVTKGWSRESHRHTIFEFVYVASGQIEQHLNGNAYTLREKDALLIKPGVYHSISPIPQNTDLFVFHFEVEDKTINEILQSTQTPLIYTKKNKNMDNFISEFLAKYDDFLDESTFNASNSIHQAIVLLEVQADILRLLSLVSYYFTDQTNMVGLTSINPSDTYLANEASYLIETHANEHLKITDIANRLNVDRSYLSHCFKKVYGFSPRTYLTTVRIRKAKELLIDTNWSIEKIAYELQFSSAAHFSHSFLKAVGKSPLKYRNHSKE